MRQVGCLGNIPFYVSDKALQTFENVQWSGSSQFSEHKRHLTDSLTEATGRDADKFSLDIKLSAFLGVNPWDALLKLWDYMRNYVSLPLIIGERAYGKYRWVIKNIKIKMKYYDGSGNMIACDVSVSLTEYQKTGR